MNLLLIALSERLLFVLKRIVTILTLFSCSLNDSISNHA